MYTYGSDGEELIDTKVRGVHLTDSRLRPSQVCVYGVIWALACLLSGKILMLNGSMHTKGTKFHRQRWRRVADRHQSWGCAFDGQPTMALPIMPLWAKACWVCWKNQTLERIDAHLWNKFSRQRWWRGVDRHQGRACAFDGQPTTALQNYSSRVWYGHCPVD